MVINRRPNKLINMSELNKKKPIKRPVFKFNAQEMALFEAGCKVIDGKQISYHYPFVLRQTFFNSKTQLTHCILLAADSEDLTTLEKDMIIVPSGRQAWAVYTADEWFSRASMNLIGVFTDIYVMNNELKKIMSEDTLKELMARRQAVSAEYNYLVEAIKLNVCE